jgi:hypothetical protein
VNRNRGSMEFNNEVSVFKWWAMIRWFMLIVLFSIGMLHLSENFQVFTTLIFVGVLFGIVILNLLYRVNTKFINSWVTAFQVVLDIVFATMLVHITGYFVWIYLMGVITASLSIPQLGGIFAGLIGSVSLFGLIMLYQFKVLTPIMPEATGDISSRTVYVLSYTALFCGVAMIAGYITDQMNYYSAQLKQKQISIDEIDSKLTSADTMLKANKTLTRQREDLIKAAAGVANIDHDLNTPLCIISLSIGRVKRMGIETNNDALLKTSNEVTDAINRINFILQRLNPLKNNPLIPEYKEGQSNE